jgi:hypothetical protein
MKSGCRGAISKKSLSHLQQPPALKKGFRFDTFPVSMKAVAFTRVTGARISATKVLANLRYATI